METNSSNHEKLFNEICEKLNSLSQLTQESVAPTTPDPMLQELSEDRARMSDQLIEMSSLNESLRKDVEIAHTQLLQAKERLHAQYLRFESIEHNYITQLEESQLSLQNLQTDYQDLHRKWSKRSEFKTRIRKGLSRLRRNHIDEKSQLQNTIRAHIAEVEKTKNELKFTRTESQAEHERHTSKTQSLQEEVKRLEGEIQTAQNELQNLSREQELRYEAERKILAIQLQEATLKEKIEALTLSADDYKRESASRIQSIEESLQFYKTREAELMKEKTQMMNQSEIDLRQIRENLNHYQTLLEEREKLLNRALQEKTETLQAFEKAAADLELMTRQKIELEGQNASLFSDLTLIQTKTAHVEQVVQQVTEKYRSELERIESLIEFERVEGKKRNQELDNRKRLIEEKNRKIRDQEQEILDLHALVEDLKGQLAISQNDTVKPKTILTQNLSPAISPVASANPIPKNSSIFGGFAKKAEDISLSDDALRKYEEIQRRNMDLDSLNGL
ncbi:MAG: hypothetical protein AB7H97_09765 [Pseudobdellovibrionaceae bacterium]